MKTFLAILLTAGTVCAEQSILNTFTSGELSPHLDARVDFEKYRSGCRTLENFVVLPYGGALKRPGTQYVAETKSNGVARLASFAVGVDQTYIMELGEKYIRFYSDGVQLVDSGNVPIEVTTPYGADDVFEVQLAQFADTVYMVHPDHPVQKLQRTTTAPTFTIADLEFDWPATIEENLTDTTITPSATTGSVTLTASSAIWTTNHIGSDWVLRSPNEDNKIELDESGAGTFTSAVINVEGEWNLIVKNIHAYETLTLQISEDGGNTWGDFREYGDLESTDYDRSGLESEQGIKYRMVMTTTTSTADGNKAGGYARFKSEEPYVNGFVTITNYTSATQVTAVVQSELGSTEATEIWYEGAFSDERGYPRTVEFFQNRLWFGGTSYQVNTLWCSATDDYENFKTGTFDDSALQISVNSDNIIEWLLARNQLFIGTLGDEWIVDGGDSGTPVTPTSILARRQTSFGSKDGIDALIASDSIVYLQRQGRKLREFEYSLEADAYKSVDITLLAEHITEGGVVQIAEQQQPEPIIWCVRGDGELIGMTYNKLQNVYGWHRHTTDGDFESVAVIPTEGEDRVYVVVNRDNGRYIEWFRPVEWGNDDDAWFVDSGLDYDGGDSVTITAFTSGTNSIYVTSDYGPVNGTYTYNSQTNGYGMWINGADKILRDTNWLIYDSTNVAYISTDDVAYPWLATNWYPVAYTTTSTDAMPAGLQGTVYWYDRGSVENGEIVLYDPTDTYAYWNNGTGWIISAVADVGSSPTDYFATFPNQPTITDAGGYALTYTSIDATTTEVNLCTGTPTDVVIPETADGGRTVVSISGNVFRSRTSLTSISFPDSLTSIGDSAFRDCTSLTSISLPDSLTSIGNYSFANCEGLDYIYFYGDAPTVGIFGFVNVGIGKAYYKEGATGFTNPWKGLETVEFPTDGAIGFGSWSGTITISEESEATGTATLRNAPLVATATNTFSDGDKLLLSGQGGLSFAGYGDGIFVATNCTATNFNILYKTGDDVFASGTYTGGVTATEVQNTFTNVSHLAGQTVSIFADGGVWPAATVSTNGVLTTPDYHNRVIAGLPYTARLSPMYIDIVNSQGSSYGKTKSPYKVHFRVKDSGVFQYGSTTNALYDVTIRGDTLPAGRPVPFSSGDPTTKMIDTAPSTAPEFWVVSDKPLPLELLSLTIYTKVSEYK